MDNSQQSDAEISEYEGSLEPPDTEPIGYHFRFTFSGQQKNLEKLNDANFMNRCKMIHNKFVSMIMDHGYVYRAQLTSGFEIRNKLGENCKAHFHVAFKSRHVKQSMSRTFKRYLEKTWDELYAGNQCFSFKEIMIRATDEFFRYPLKQTLDRKVCRGFSDEQLEIMHKVAKESYGKIVEINQKKAEKRESQDTLFLKVMYNIKKLPVQPKNGREIARQFVEYYKDHNLPINGTVIKGYVTLAMLKMDILTIDDYIESIGL